ncbi:engulfment and cell motility protein 1 [Clonorchis sinensis]|uniref:Engulfment and cell motility protein 1 n=1 Tax=Clonorchis sinensis TaxID=79923 RepID=H2KT39_CLOSI|nr:engulfment and cell motility protein 1 [Clonorchis sinensis]
MDHVCGPMDDSPPQMHCSPSSLSTSVIYTKCPTTYQSSGETQQDCSTLLTSFTTDNLHCPSIKYSRSRYADGNQRGSSVDAYSNFYVPDNILCVCKHRLSTTDKSSETSSREKESKKTTKSFIRRVRSLVSQRKRMLGYVDKPSNSNWDSRSDMIKFSNPDGNKPHISQLPVLRSGLDRSSCAIIRTVSPVDTNITLALPIHFPPPRHYESSREQPEFTTTCYAVEVTCDRVNHVSMAAQQFLEQIETVLRCTHWEENEYQTVIAVLAEITNLLPCQKFATEFLKVRGHETIFRLVEQFSPAGLEELIRSPTSATTAWYPQPKLWKYVAACLVELAEYGLNSSEDSAGGSDEHFFCLDGPIYGMQDADSEKRSTLISPMSDSPEFSWFLASERFLSVLVLQCQLATEMKSLRDSIRSLLKIMNDCPPHAEYVIRQIDPEFIFERLQKVHELQKEATQVETPTSTTATNSSTMRNVLSRVGSISLSSISSTSARTPLTRFDSSASIDSSTDEFNSPTDQLLVDVVSLLLDMLYVILYQSRQSGKLAERLPLYLSDMNLRRLNIYFPQLRHPVTPLERNPNPDGSETDGVRRDPGVFRNEVTITGGRSTFYVQDVPKMTVPKNCVNSIRVCQTGNDVSAGLSRLQQAYLIYLADELRASLDEESRTGLEKLNDLCQLGATDLDLTLDDPNNPELLFIQLGFRHPKTPLDDFQPAPGRLGYNCLYSFFRHYSSLKKQMLNYQPAVQRNLSTLRPPLPDTGLKLRPSKSAVSARESMTPNSQAPSLYPGSWARGVRRKTLDMVSYDHPPRVDVIQPLFPLVAVAAELVKTICDVIGVPRQLDPLPRWHPKTLSSLNKTFYPILFQPRNQLLTPFEELFVSSFFVLFDTWTQLSAGPGDITMVLSVLREQLIQALAQTPYSFNEFERILTHCTPKFVRSVWKEEEEYTRCRTMESHGVLKDLRARLTKVHELNVKEHRLNYLTYHGALEYSPPKRQQGRDISKMEVILSPDRKSLLVREVANHNPSHPSQQQLQQPTVCEIWPLACVDRVSTGSDERLKKNPERTLILHMRIRESPEPLQVLLLARTVLDHSYWMDGFSILLNRDSFSDLFREDVQRLLELDMKVRLCGLELHRIPSKLKLIPPDPPEFDFEEQCV